MSLNVVQKKCPRLRNVIMFNSKMKSPMPMGKSNLCVIKCIGKKFQFRRLLFESFCRITLNLQYGQRVFCLSVNDGLHSFFICDVLFNMQRFLCLPIEYREWIRLFFKINVRNWLLCFQKMSEQNEKLQTHICSTHSEQFSQFHLYKCEAMDV